MASDLTTSPVDRQNILNNQFAVTEIQKASQIQGVYFEGAIRLVKEQIAEFFEIDVRTVERYLTKYGDELGQNGYEVIKGKQLESLK